MVYNHFCLVFDPSDSFILLCINLSRSDSNSFDYFIFRRRRPADKAEMESRARVTIVVDDVNDNPPVPTQESMVVTLCQNLGQRFQVIMTSLTVSRRRVSGSDNSIRGDKVFDRKFKARRSNVRVYEKSATFVLPPRRKPCITRQGVGTWIKKTFKESVIKSRLMILFPALKTSPAPSGTRALAPSYRVKEQAPCWIRREGVNPSPPGGLRRSPRSIKRPGCSGVNISAKPQVLGWVIKSRCRSG